jgi:hypothetical protein
VIALGWLATIVIFWLVGDALGHDLPKWLAGVGATGAILFVLGVLHVPFLAALLALGAAILVALARRRPAGWPGAVSAPLLIPIALVLLVVSLDPLHDYDGNAFWLPKAQAIATEHSITGPYFRGTGTASLRNQYPLLIPLDGATIMTIARTTDAEAVRWLYPLILLALANEVRKRAGILPALILITLPQLLTAPEGGATSAYSDIALAAFATMAFFELLNAASPARLGFWAACAALTKNEGLPFALVLCVAGAFVFRKRIAAALIPVTVAVTALFVWRAQVPRTDEEDLMGLLRLLPQRLGRFPEAIGGFARYAVKLDDWGIFWIAVALALALLAWRKQWRPLALACGVIGAMIGVYVAIFMVTEWSLPELMKVSASRLWAHFAGIGAWTLSASSRNR